MVGYREVQEARARIGEHIHHTPLLYSRSLSEMSGNEVYLKCENLQKTGSFKIRGALNAVLQLSPEERGRGVVTGSSGNHGQALAYAARLAGARSVVVLPENVSKAKREACLAYGSEIVFCGLTAEARLAQAQLLAHTQGLTMVHSFDNEDVIAGQGTAALEILADLPAVDYIVAPVGGGGLLSGLAVAAKTSGLAVKVIGVEPSVSPRLRYSWQQGKVSELTEDAWQPSVADGLRARRPGVFTFSLTQQYVDQLVTVGEAEIVSALRLILERTKLLAEPSGAVSVAFALGSALAGRGKKVVCVVSGGNMELTQLAQLLA